MKYRWKLISLAIAAVLAPATHAEVVRTAGDKDQTLSVINVLGNGDTGGGNPVSQSATGLSISAKETPQAVSEINEEVIKGFALDDINSVLDMAIGVSVERVETDRTYFIARGFDIKNFQIDGIGLPVAWGVSVGSIDAALYEKVEVVRGANGLLVGTGNPSGAINFIRKRPTAAYEGNVKITQGSWDKRRVEGDVSTPLNDNWSMRVVAASQDKESWLDRYESDRSLFYAVIEGQLTDSTLLTMGYSDNRSHGDNPLWGALPLLQSDNTQAEYDVSDSTSMHWAFFKTQRKNSFVEILQELSPTWISKTTVTYSTYEEPSELFYMYGTPDPDTGLGLMGYPGKYDSYNEQFLLDSQVSGEYSVGGRNHELTAGIGYGNANSGYLQYDAPADDPSWGALPAFPGWTGYEIKRPDFGPGHEADDTEDKYRRAYAATRLSVSDALKFIAGFNAISVQSKGFSFGESSERDEQQVSPYAGVIYALTNRINAYASYSDIFDPQSERDINYKMLGAAKGASYETGLKIESADGKALGTIAVFHADQENLQEAAGWDATRGVTYYKGTEMSSEGIELEFAGIINNELKLYSGYTWLEVEDDEGEEARTYVPRQSMKVASIYRPAAIEPLELGGSLRWQDDIHTGSSPTIVRQDAYAVLSAYASWDVNRNLELALNLDNITNEKYLASLYWDQAFYAEPRSVEASMKFSF